MTDPLSVTGSAVGIISLGLQVCQGLTSYYQAWRAYDADLDQAGMSAKDLTNSLTLLQSTLQKISSTPNALSHAEKSIASCEDGIRDLEVRLLKCRSTPVPTSRAEKFQLLAQRSLYPFKKKTVDSLKAIIAELQRNVDTAIQIVELDLLGEIKKSVSDSKLSSANAVADISLARTTLEEFRAESVLRLQLLPNIEKGVQTIGNGLAGMRASLDSVVTNTVESKAGVTRVLPVIEAGTARIPAIEQTMIARFDRQEQQNAEMRRLLMQLLAKPSLLEATCDDAVSRGLLTKANVCSNPDLSNWKTSRMRSRQRCSCRRRMPIQLISGRRFINPFYEDYSQHEKSCPLWSSTEKSKTFGLRLSQYGNILARATEISLSITYGAGGFSISPLLSFGRLRRPEGSPAFVVFYDLDKDGLTRYYWDPVVKDCPPASFESIWTAKLQEIQRLFDSGKASPTDVDGNGLNILHIACVALARIFDTETYGSAEALVVCRILLRLIELGIPSSEFCDETNVIPLTYYVLNFINRFKLGKRLDLLTGVEPLLEEAEVMIGDSQYRLDPAWLATPPNIRLRISESFDCGMLSNAIIAQSEKDVLSCLHTNRRSVNERTSSGHTPLHLATSWPHGVSLLMAAGADVNALDHHGRSALDYSIELGCVKSMALLLNADCDMSNPYFGRVNGNQMAMVIANALINRRSRLLSLGLDQLPQYLTKKLALDRNRLPDAHAGSIIDALEAHGIDVPSSIKSSMIFSTPIYARHNWLDIDVAEHLFKNGFIDIDTPNNRGLSPLMRLDYYREIPEYICWLLDKGADLHYTPNDARPAAAHYVARFIINPDIYAFDNSGLLEMSGKLNQSHLATECGNRLVLELLAKDFTDGCVCACSARGCGIFTTMFKFLRPLSENPRTIRIYIRRVSSLIEWVSLTLGPNHPYLPRLPLDTIRFFTFEALGLRHTCCRYDFDKDYGDHDFIFLDGAEVTEIREEETELIAQLEDLIAELHTKFDELAMPIVNFLEGYWDERMDEFLHPTDPPDPEVIQRAMEIGVILKT